MRRRLLLEQQGKDEIVVGVQVRPSAAQHTAPAAAANKRNVFWLSMPLQQPQQCGFIR
jgi:hypothetical protein